MLFKIRLASLATTLLLGGSAALAAPAGQSCWDRDVERMEYLTNPPERGDNNFFTTVVAQTGNVSLVYPAKASLAEFTERLYRIRADLGGSAPARCTNQYLNGLTYFMPKDVNAPAGSATYQGSYNPNLNYPDPETYTGGGAKNQGFDNASYYQYGAWPVGGTGTPQSAAAACTAMKNGSGVPIIGGDLAECIACVSGTLGTARGYWLNPYVADRDTSTNAGVFAGRFLNFQPPKWALLRLAYKRLVNGPLLSVLREAVVAQNGAIGGQVVQFMLPQSCNGSGRPLNQKQKAVDTVSYTNVANPIAEMLFNTAWYMGGQEKPWWFTSAALPGNAMAQGKSGPCSGCNADFMVLFSDGRADSANPRCTLDASGNVPAFCSAAANCGTVGMGQSDDGNEFLNPGSQSDVAAAISGPGVRQTWPGTCDMDFADDVAGWANASNVSMNTPGTHVKTYVVGIGDPRNTYGEMSILQGIATRGDGIYTVAKDFRTLETNIEQVFNDIIRRATSFSVAAITTVQTRGSTFAFIPRFRPLQGPQWEGRLLRYKLFNEFAAGCDPVVDKNVKNAVNPNGNASCGDLYLQDKNNNFILEDQDAGVFEQLDSSQTWQADGGWPWKTGSQPDGGTGPLPATPIWEAEDELEKRVNRFIAGAIDDRRIYTVAPDSAGGYGPALISFEVANAAAITPLLQLGGKNGDFCTSLAGLTRHNYATDDDCTVDVINFMRGYDVMLQNPVNRASPDGGYSVTSSRPHVMGDIFHSSPILVTPPVTTALCRLGLANQCVESLYADKLTPDAPTPGSGFAHAYEEYQSKNATRAELVLVGANDGMLHAFNAGNWVAGDDPDTPSLVETAHYDLGSGKEEWAFIPPDLLPKLQRYIVNTRHDLLVDGTPMVRDVWVDGSGASTVRDGKKQPDEFHTVAVVGEREGGRHYFALDVTDPFNPKYLWMWPPPGLARTLNVGESWDDIAPGSPPIVNVAVANATGPLNVHGAKASEKWVIGLGGGYDPDLLRGRAFYVLDVWSGQLVYKFSKSDSTGAADPRDALFPIAAPVSFVDTDGDFIFDTAIVGDTAGQLWAFALALPGSDTDGDGYYDNWFGGRAFNEFAGQAMWHRSPFFQRAAVTVVPLQSGPVVRALLGSGNRDQMKNGLGGTCGLSDLDACLRQDCSVDVLANRRRIGPAPSSSTAGHYALGEWKYTSGTSSLATNTLNLTSADSQSTSCTDIGIVDILYTLTCGSTAQTYETNIYCDWGASGGAECPVANGKPLATQLPWTPSVPQEYTRFYSVSVWGSGKRAMPASTVQAAAYDGAALTESSLVDATGCPLNATAGSCASPTGNGWYVVQNNSVTGQLRKPGDEKTGSAALVLAGCALWNTLLPNNQAALTCSGALPPDNAFVFQADALTGHVQCGVTGSATAQATTRSVRRDTTVTPQQFTPVVSLNAKSGEVAYSGVSLEPGSPPVQVQVGTGNVVGNIHWLEVPRSLHDCRHGDGGCQ
ncbi:MAG: pilus assembly protein [Myxococcales bacterium]